MFKSAAGNDTLYYDVEEVWKDSLPDTVVNTETIYIASDRGRRYGLCEWVRS